MRITDLLIDPASVGSRYWLVDVAPAYVYVNHQRTDTISGYRYFVVLPEREMDKIAVKIDGEQRLPKPNGYTEVCFDELKLFLQWSRDDYVLTGSAAGIHPVKQKA